MRGLRSTFGYVIGLLMWAGVASAQEYGQSSGDPVVSGTLPGTVIQSNPPVEPAPVDDTIRETLSIEAPTAAPNFTLPKRGTSMIEVERQLGKPARAVAAVGTPPISRWEYPNFTIYFEHDLVLHAVSNEKKRKTP